MSDVNIIIDPQQVSLYQSENKELTITGLPEGADVTWESSDPTIATFNGDTKNKSEVTIKAEAPGKTTITAEVTYQVDGVGETTPKDVQCEVTVYGIKLNESELVLGVNDCRSLGYVVNLSESDKKEIKWSSSAPDCVTVEAGEVVAVKPGKATITAQVEHSEQTLASKCEVLVFGLDSSKLSMVGTGTLKAMGPENVEFTVKWNNENSDVATISENSTGKEVTITSKTLGKTKITATIECNKKTCKAECEVTVGIKLNDSELFLEVGNAKSLGCTLDQSLSKASITWSSSAPDCVTVEAGEVVAVKPGKATITAQVEHSGQPLESKCDVYVMGLDNSELTLAIDESKVIKATVPPEATVTWNGEGKGVANVKDNGSDATITGVTEGTENIEVKVTPKNSNKTYFNTCKVTVKKPKLIKNEVTLVKGKTFQLKCDYEPGKENYFTWETDKEAVATVSGNGLVTAVAKGETTIKVKHKHSTTDKFIEIDSCNVSVEDSERDAVASWVDKRLDRSKDITDKYKFTFTHSISYEVGTGLEKEEETETTDVSLIHGDKETKSLKISENKSEEYSFILTEVSFHKEIYQPGYVEVVINTKAPLSIFNGWVSLEYTKKGEQEDSSDIYSIAKNYYIFEKKKKGEYVTLKAYSADKFLTLDKFCQVYSGKTLVDGMVETTFANYGATVNFTAYSNTIKKSDSTTSLYNPNLQHLNSAIQIPYAVQYNESFYEFLVRMCNRHGEFLFCENNQLHVGLEISTAVGTITESEDVEIECSESGWIYKSEVNTLFSDCLGENGVGGKWDKESNKIVRGDNYEMFVNESIYPGQYFEAYQKSGTTVNGVTYNHACKEDFKLPTQRWFDYLKALAENQTLYEAFAKVVLVKLPMTESLTAVSAKNINKSYNEIYFKGKSVDKYYPFSADAEDLNVEFYDTILLKEKEAEENKVIVRCSTCQKYLLGDIVKINEKDHVVYSVKGSAKVVNGVLDGVRRYVDTYELLLLPLVKGDDEIEKYYPLPMPERRIRKASPQRAIVKNSKDPQKLSRVQVIYPWQPKNDTNKSPWLRIAYPMASGEGGFVFSPQEDDEVLIDYEGGNIERPFVVGSFYSGERKPAIPAQMHTLGVVKSITSPNGHHISFKDPSHNAKFLANLIPVWSLLSKFGIGVKFDDDFFKTHGKHLVGGFEISDYYGVYSIKGSTEDRNITINSPIGNIMLDAFSGITINAPHGNVKILGKNVDIEARNNLTITSGTNIKNSFVYSRRHGDKEMYLHKSLASLTSVFLGGWMKNGGLDLSFYRTCLEAVFKPIGGTMLIKSHRFMNIEAGNGMVPMEKLREKPDGELAKVGYLLGSLSRISFNSIGKTHRWLADLRKIFEVLKEDFCEFLEVEQLRADVLQKLGLFEAELEVDTKRECLAKIPEDGPNKKDTPDLGNVTLEPERKAIYKSLYNACYALAKKYDKISEMDKIPGMDKSSEIEEDVQMAISVILGDFADDRERFFAFVRNVERPQNYEVADDLKNSKLQMSQKKSLYNLLRKYMLNSEIKVDLPNWNENKDFLDTIRYYHLPKVLKEAENPGKSKIWENIVYTGLKKGLGVNGMRDDNVWSINEKGGVYFSTEKGLAFRLAADGKLTKSDYDMSVYRLIEDCIRTISGIRVQPDTQRPAPQRPAPQPTTPQQITPQQKSGTEFKTTPTGILKMGNQK